MKYIFIVGSVVLVFYLFKALLEAPVKWYANLTFKKYHALTTVFSDYYVDARKLFLFKFEEIANVHVIDKIKTDEAYRLLTTGQFGNIAETYQYCTYNWDEGCQQFINTILVFENKMIVSIHFEEVVAYFSGSNYTTVVQLFSNLAVVRKHDFASNVDSTRVRVTGFAREEEILN
jgi:hypothetical protein